MVVERESSQEPSSPATFWIPRVTDQGLSEALLRNGTHCKKVPLDEMAMCWPTTGAGEGLQNCFVIDTAVLVSSFLVSMCFSLAHTERGLP